LTRWIEQDDRSYIITSFDFKPVSHISVISSNLREKIGVFGKNNKAPVNWGIEK